MALHSYALTTVDDAKTWLDVSGTDYDSLLELLINQSTDYMEHYCNRRFTETAYSSEEYDGSGTKELLLEQWPVNSGETFTLQRNRAYDNTDDWDTIDADDYWVDYDNGIITGNTMGDFLKRKFKYRVDYTAGYATIPSDLALCCLMLVSFFWNKRKAMGISRERVGDFSVDFGEMMTDINIRNVLERYKRHSL